MPSAVFAENGRLYKCTYDGSVNRFYEWDGNDWIEQRKGVLETLIEPTLEGAPDAR